jgi:hypothetical protein
MEYLAALNAFCLQLNEFCLHFQREILSNPIVSVSGPARQLAKRFGETLILCPTPEAARTSIRRDPEGARSFLIAAEGVLRRIRTQPFQFARECPRYQTRFYLLCCAVEEFVDSNRQAAPTQAATSYSGKVPVLPS